jgi:transposase
MYLGLDIAKAKIDCCLMHDTKYLHRTFENNQDGFIKLNRLVRKTHSKQGLRLL